MSRRKQQRPLQIVDEDTQETVFSEIDAIAFNEDSSKFETEGEKLKEIDIADFSIKPETTDISLNGNSQESFSDSELDGTSVRTCVRSEHDLYELLNPSRKRRKYIRGGDKVCMICGKVTKSPSDLERHIRVHTGERPFQCVICYKPFKCKRSQQSHQYICHDLSDGLSESRIALLDIHKKQRADMFTKLKKELSKDKIELYDDSINATILQNSITQLEELLNNKGYQNNINSNCLTTQSDCLKYSSAIHNAVDSVPKQNGSDDTFHPLSKEAISLQRVCVWNNNESELISASEKEPGEKSYLCELCGQDFSSLVHFNSHHQTVHENDSTIQNNFLKIHPNNFSFKPTQVDSDKISSSLDKSSHYEMKSCNDAELMKNKQHPSNDIDKEDGKNFSARKCQENKFNGQMDQHTSEQDICLSNSLEQYSGLYQSLLIGNSPVIPDTYLLTNSDMNKNDCSFSWHNIKIHSEKVLITRLEGVHSTTEQNYILYKCCLCGSSYPGLGILCSHLAAHSQYSKEHSCEKCGAVFKRRSQLEVHEQVHRVIEDKLLLLPNYAFSNPLSDAVNHSNPFLLQTPLSQQLTSSQISTIACSSSPLSSPLLRMMLQPTNSEDNGSTSFASNTNAAFDRLTEPKRANNKHGNPLQCKYCPKTFDRIFSLQRHERIHTGIKPCCCKICGRGFSERRNLRHHIIRFHSDSNQRDFLRRGRRPCYQRNNNSSLRLISFLKRTAVRILNSIDQTRFDTSVSPVTSSELAGYNEAEGQETNLSENVESNSKSLKDVSDNENVTVVIPIDVSDGSNKSDDCSLPNHQSVLESKELLKDPKQSLIGSRRKGRPYKFNPMHGSVDNIETKLFSQDNLNEQQENFLFSPADVDYLFQELNVLNFDGDGTVSATETDQFSDADKLPDKAQESMPSKLRGHGAFFSNYNPSFCRKNCSTSDLNRHTNFHEDVRPYKCSYCNYYSRTNSQLKVHTMRHQGIKQFLCHTCNYNGVTQSDLNRHCKTRTHLLRARNICMWCKLGFYTPMLLDEHIRSYHQTEIMVADDIAPHTKQEIEGNHQTPSDTNLQQPSKDLTTASSIANELLPQTNSLTTKQVNGFENNNYLPNTESSDGERNQIGSPVGATDENIPCIQAD